MYLDLDSCEYQNKHNYLAIALFWVRRQEKLIRHHTKVSRKEGNAFLEKLIKFNLLFMIFF